MKRLLEELGIAELTEDQLEKLCETGEKAARAYVLSKVPKKEISTLDITVDAEGSKPVTVNVEVEITLSPSTKNLNVNKLAQEATEKAFDAIKQYLRESSCKSTK